jgi:hypothetical protein
MLHTQHGIQRHNVGGVGHYSIHNGQEKNTVNTYYLLDGTLGDWKTEPVSSELKEGAKPYHRRPYPVPKIYRETTTETIINTNLFIIMLLPILI